MVKEPGRKGGGAGYSLLNHEAAQLRLDETSREERKVATPGVKRGTLENLPYDGKKECNIEGVSSMPSGCTSFHLGTKRNLAWGRASKPTGREGPNSYQRGAKPRVGRRVYKIKQRPPRRRCKKRSSISFWGHSVGVHRSIRNVRKRVNVRCSRLLPSLTGVEKCFLDIQSCKL